MTLLKLWLAMPGEGEDELQAMRNRPADCGGGPVSPVAFAKGFAQIASEA